MDWGYHGNLPVGGSHLRGHLKDRASFQGNSPTWLEQVT